jgi:cell wall-associated NlpC family hydrolase
MPHTDTNTHTPTAPATAVDPSRRTVRARTLAALVAFVTVVSLTVGASPAAADTRSQYEAAKAQLERLSQQSDLLIDAWNGQNERVEQVTKQVAELERKVAALKVQVDDTRTTLNSQAVSVYKYGSTQTAAGMVAIFSVRSVDEVPRAGKYLDQVQGDTRRALEQFSASQADAEEENAQLARAKAEQEKLLRDLAAKKNRIEASIAQQEQITARFKAQLDAERARAAAEARARAERAQAEAAARSRVQAQAQSPAPGRAAAPAPARGGAPAPAAAPAPAGGGGSGRAAAPAPAPAADPAPSVGYSSVVGFVRGQLGKPYRWGATGPGSFDCSGLIVAAYRSVGRSLPRTSSSMAGLPRVSSPQPGDIAWRPGHVGMYVGGGQVIHSPRTGDVVKYESASRYRSFHRP